MFVAILGVPAIHAVAAFPVLVSVIFIPTIVPVGIQPVIGVGAGGLRTVGGLDDAHRIGSGSEAKEAIGALPIGGIRCQRGATGVLEGDQYVRNARVIPGVR